MPRLHDSPTPLVVVGVDGSRESWRAIHAGAWEARMRQATLVLAHGYPETAPYLWYGWTPPLIATTRDLQAGAGTVLEATAGRVRTFYPDLRLRTLLRPGTGSKVLAEASRRAALVVVGARGRGGFGGLLVGSIAAQIAAHASSPVMVIRPTERNNGEDNTAPDAVVPQPGQVFVGVDGSSGQDATLSFAFEAASMRGVPLVAVHVWWNRPYPNLGRGILRPSDPAVAPEVAHQFLTATLAAWSSKYPEVRVEQRSEHSLSPSDTLIAASDGAGLVVVGSRGRGGFAGLLVGSVGRDLIGHARSPVAVVHPQLNVRANDVGAANNEVTS